MTRTCRVCGTTKDDSEFYTHTSGEGAYLRTECKTCIQEHRLRKKFGIGFAQYEAMLNSQDRRCAICTLHIDDYVYRGKRERFHVDHCHKTGRIRGLLCAGCNTAIGLLKDDPGVAQRASDYLCG